MGISPINAGDQSFFEDQQPGMEEEPAIEKEPAPPQVQPLPVATVSPEQITQIQGQIQQIEAELQSEITNKAGLSQFLETDDKLKAVMHVLKGVVEQVKASGQPTGETQIVELQTAMEKLTSIGDNLNTQMVGIVMGDIKNLKKS